MRIQSLSIEVPTKTCVNNCPFCVSKAHVTDYKDCMSDPRFEQDYADRLETAREGTNTVILTGTGEALQNKSFLRKFTELNKKLHKPFYIIELQTSGVFLDDETLDFLRNEINVKTISLSVSDLFDSKNNLSIMQVPKKLEFDLDDVCKRIKEKGFNLRISLNVLKNTEEIIVKNEEYDFDIIFDRLTNLGTDQVTFREMWKSNNDKKIDKWIDDNSATISFFPVLNNYVKTKKLIGKLTFGTLQYDVNDISVVLDEDCMSEEIKDSIKYLILRPNAKLYKKWNSKASLVF